MILIAGPCVIEGDEWLADVACEIKDIVDQHDWIEDFYFKSSFDKANRTSAESFRGPGLVDGLLSLEKASVVADCKTLTDIHTAEQAKDAATVVDAIQIPAMLSRQTDLIAAAAKTGLPLNMKKGPWMDAVDAQQMIKKARHFGAGQAWICDRGTSYGPGHLVTDIPMIVDMAKNEKVIFDCTHSVQCMGGGVDVSTGRRGMIPFVSRAVVATGVLDGLFMEVHPDPAKAKSDAACQLPLHQLDCFLTGLGELLEVV